MNAQNRGLSELRWLICIEDWSDRLTQPRSGKEEQIIVGLAVIPPSRSAVETQGGANSRDNAGGKQQNQQTLTGNCKLLQSVNLGKFEF